MSTHVNKERILGLENTLKIDNVTSNTHAIVLL